MVFIYKNFYAGFFVIDTYHIYIWVSITEFDYHKTMIEYINNDWMAKITQTFSMLIV